MNSARGSGRVIVVGGGVLGTMHAVAARRRGFEVVHLEREPDARGASVRNFGLVWVSGRAPGPELDLALLARERWAQISAEVPGVGFRPHGSLTLAAGRPGHRARRARHDLLAGHSGGDIRMSAPITIACLDMAGTTVRDDGIVMAAFASAIAGRGLSPAEYTQAMKDVRASMGQSKIEVFRRVLGDEEAAVDANQAFEHHYAAAVRAGEVAPLPGAVPVMTALRAAGVKVCLLTGFSPATRDALIDALDWRPLIDLALSPADAGRGRPWPDLPLTALLRLGGGAVGELATVGDTPSDIESGLRAGAGLVAGVLTGSTSREELIQAGAPHILDTVAGLPALLGR